MKMIFRLAVLLTAIALLASCAHSPRSFKDTEAIQQMRLDFIASHPNGGYNNHVLKGEVVKGMNFMSVLASWGLPNVRKVQPASIYEYWTYYTEDKASGQMTIYDLIFKDQVLSGWKIDKTISSNGGLRYIDDKRPVVLNRSNTSNQGGKALKKKPKF